jgi:multicomponent Na+:H+ antiporter subunit D
MMPVAELAQATTADGGFLLVLAIFLPVAGLLAAFSLGGRHVERTVLVTMVLVLATVGAIVLRVLDTGFPLVYVLGAWAPPLGVTLRADGLAVAMLGIVAVVALAVGIYARADFETPGGADEARKPFVFWILLMGIWAGLNTVFLSGDLFTLYVALEVLTFAAVPLVSLEGRADNFSAALRYLLFALLGSILYLGGAGVLYGAYGTLDVVLLAEQITASPVTCIAAAMMTVGMLAKTALVPLHLWLPPAHAGAPAAGSAVLSALVVKGSFFIVIRLWFDVMPGLPGASASQLLSALGAAAILLGSIVALRQSRLKLLIAYSTLAQIGYLFLMFALALDPASSQLERGGALAGGMLQAITHAAAKAAMFMIAGLVYAGLGHDRIAEMPGLGRAAPLTVLAFALAGFALMGVPPSGAYLAKNLLLDASTETGQWWWTFVLNAGGVLTSSYVFLVLAHALASTRKPVELRLRRSQELAALALALCALSLGLVSWGAVLPVPAGTTSGAFGLATAWKVFWPALAGGILAMLIGRWGDPWQHLPMRDVVIAIVAPPRRATLPIGTAFERVDAVLCQWPVAGLSLLLLVVFFSAAFLSTTGAPR